jgi:hypothetical protein
MPNEVENGPFEFVKRQLRNLGQRRGLAIVKNEGPHGGWNSRVGERFQN